jgi:hypothetical protein
VPHRSRSSDDDPTIAETKHAIADSARGRKFSRPPRNASVLPNQQVADRTPIWSAPPNWPMDDESKSPCPLAQDHDGRPFEPPPNAVAWLVLHQRLPRSRPTAITWRDSTQYVLIALDTTRTQLLRLMGRRLGWLILQPIDSEGRLLKARQAVVPCA